MELIQKLGLGLFGLGARRASTGSGAQGDARTRGRQARRERDSGDSQQRSSFELRQVNRGLSSHRGDHLDLVEHCVLGPRPILFLNPEVHVVGREQDLVTRLEG